MKYFLISLLSVLLMSTMIYASVNFGGDFRYRHIGIYQENEPDQVKQQVRFRLDMEAPVNDYLSFNARLVTGGDDPISTNQSLTGSFTSKGVWLDQMYFDYNPYQWANIKGGKFDVPFVHTDMLFDPDLSLEGLFLQFGDDSIKFSPFVRAGGFWVNETVDGDQGMFVGQTGFKLYGLNLDAGYYNYGNLKNHRVLYEDNGYGNSVTPLLDQYIFDYDLIDINLGLKFSVFNIYGDYIYNMEADSNNVAWLVGTAFTFKYVDVEYNYRIIEKDAVVGIFTDSDFGGGGTNNEGHKISLAAKPMKNTEAKATFFLNTLNPDITNIDYNRLMLDFSIKF